MSEEDTPSKKELRAQRKEAKRLEKEKRNLLTVSENCKGCGAYMSLDQRFCAGCGAKRMYNRLNWRSLTEDFTDRFLNLEAHFPKTFIALLTKPEDVIVGYVNGVRKKYISAFGYFAIALTLAGIYIFIIKNWFLEQFIKMQAEGAKLSTGDVPNAIAEAQLEMTKSFTETLFDYNSLNYFITIPIVIIISRIVFWNYKKFNLVEHAVIHLYSFSQFAILSMILQIATIWSGSLYMVVSIVVMIGMFVYSGYVLKRVFELSWANFILKTGLFFLVLLVLGIILIAIGSAIFVYLAKSGALDGTDFFELIKQQAEMQKSLKEAALQAKDSIRRIDSLKTVKEIVIDSIR